MGGKGVVMNHPSKGCPQTGRGEAAAEGLDAMTTAELTEGLEALCETMSEENYNGVLVGAYLDALDRKAPVPDAPSAEESHAAFLRRIGGLSGEGGGARSRRAPRKLFRGGLVAAVLVVCLFSGMVAAQAAGVNVFGSIARWTGSLFSFGGPQAGYATPAPSATPQPELTEEYLESLLPVVPEGFEVEESDFYVNSEGGVYGFAEFTENDNFIIFSAEKAPNKDNSLFEKDLRQVLSLSLSGVDFYIFENNDLIMAAWQTGGLECGIFSNLEKDTLISIIINSYGEE